MKHVPKQPVSSESSLSSEHLKNLAEQYRVKYPKLSLEDHEILVTGALKRPALSREGLERWYKENADYLTPWVMGQIKEWPPGMYFYEAGMASGGDMIGHWSPRKLSELERGVEFP